MMWVSRIYEGYAGRESKDRISTFSSDLRTSGRKDAVRQSLQGPSGERSPGARGRQQAGGVPGTMDNQRLGGLLRACLRLMQEYPGVGEVEQLGQRQQVVLVPMSASVRNGTSLSGQWVPVGRL